MTARNIALICLPAVYTVVRERDKGHIDPYRFIVYDNGGSATIYYDDIEILTVYNQDAYAGGFGSAGSYAAACTELLTPVGAGCECQRYSSAVQE